MKRVLAFVATCLLAACGGGTVTGPDPAAPERQQVSSTPETAPPKPVAEVPSAGTVCSVENNGLIIAKNNTNIPQTYFGFSTNTDQGLIGAQVGPIIVRPGDTFDYHGAPKCSQVDISHQSWPTYTNVQCAAWYDANGRPFNDPRKVDWNACKSATPTPTPVPRPTPNPEPTPTPVPTPSPTPTPSPNPTPSPSPNPSPSPTPSPSPSPSPTPAPVATCIYSLAQGLNDKAGTCATVAGALYVAFDSGQGHCETVLPGVCNADFNLTPGQSAAACMKYTGGDRNCNGVADSRE